VPTRRRRFTIEREGNGPGRDHEPGHDQIACMIGRLQLVRAAQGAGRPDPTEAAKTLRVLDALAKSAAEGRRLTCEFRGQGTSAGHVVRGSRAPGSRAVSIHSWRPLGVGQRLLVRGSVSHAAR